MSGHRIERREVGPPDSFDHLSDDELERALIDRIKALGLNSEAGTPDDADAGSDTRH